MKTAVKVFFKKIVNSQLYSACVKLSSFISYHINYYILFVQILEEFIQRSELDVFNPVNHTGYWRQLTARTTRLNHLMLVIGVHPQDLSSTDLNKLKAELQDFFENGKGVEAKVTSLYFQILDRQ